MEKTLQRLLSFVLAVLMVVSCVPTSAIATEVGSEDSSYEEFTGNGEGEEEEYSEQYVETTEETEPETEPVEEVDYEAVAALEEMISDLPDPNDLAGYDQAALEALTETFLVIEDAYGALNGLSKAEAAEAWNNYNVVKGAWETAWAAIQEEPIDDLSGEDDTNETPVAGVEYAAEVNGVAYDTLQKAIDAAVYGDTVKLLSDLELRDEGIKVSADDDIMLDLNGHLITGYHTVAQEFALIENEGQLRIINTTRREGEPVSITLNSTAEASTAYAVNTILNRGTLIVEAGMIANYWGDNSVQSNQIGYAIDNNSTKSDAILTLTGGAAVQAYGSSYYDGIRQFCNSTTHTNHVTVSGYAWFTSLWVQNPSDGTAGHNTKQVNGSFTISANEGAISNIVYVEPNLVGESAITSGIIGQVVYNDTESGTCMTGFISGGKFMNAPDAAMIAEGYEAVESNGQYIIQKKAPVVEDTPAVEVPDTGVTVEGTAQEGAADALVEDLQSNEVVNSFVPTGAAEVKITFCQVQFVNNVPTKLVFDVTPVERESATSEVTFRLPIPDSVSKTHVEVYHAEETTPLGTYEIKAENGHKYVEIVASNFSNYTVVPVEAPVTAVAKIGGTGYATLADALAATETMTGDVIVEIYDKVTLNTALTGSFDSIKFVGKDADAEVYLDVQGYITATGKKVAFEGLTLSKSAGGYIGNAGFMNCAFGVYDVTEVTYTNCTFTNGAYASSGKVTFTGCTFYRSHDKYGLWAYGAVEAIVDGCTFPDIRGIKLYSEGLEKSGDLTVKNTDFSAATGKPAIVLTSGKSVTLEGNTYPTTGVFELDLAGVPNGTPITSDVLPICINDNGACGVLVDGKIYTTVAQAAAVATSGSTVTLLHDSTETVELPEGVTLNKNGFTAAGVTVPASGLKGSGTAEDPYQIATAEDLFLFAEKVNDGTYKGVYVVLTANIDLEQEDWTSIGTSANPFTGTFDGRGFTISNLWSYERGLFGYTSTGNYVDSGLNGRATIKNFTLNGAEVYNQSTSAVGGVVGEAGQNTEISNVTVTGYISIYGSGYVGGLVGKGYVHIDNCHVNGVDYNGRKSTIDASYWAVGGIIGHAGSEGGASITNCSVKNVTIHSAIYGAGAIAGVGTSGPIENVSAENVSVEAESSADANGLLVGCNYNAITGNSSVKNVVLKVNGTVVEAPQDMAATVDGAYYVTLAAAVAAADEGDTIIILTENAHDGDIVIPNGVTLNGNGKAITGNIDLSEGVIVENATVNGTVYVGGKVTFRGDNTFTMITDYGDYYSSTTPSKWTVEKGASLTLTKSDRYGLGYGDQVTIYGEIQDALTARATLTDGDLSVHMYGGLVGMTNSAAPNAQNKLLIQDAYASFGVEGDKSFGNKAGDYYGNYEIVIDNSVITANAFKFYEDLGSSVVNITGTDMLVNGVFMTNDASSKFTFTNSVIVSNAKSNGTDDKNQNAGELTLVNTSLTYSAPFTNAGTLTLGAGSSLTAPSISGAGKIVIDATGMAAGEVATITGDASGFTGTIEVINSDSLEAKIVDGKIVLSAKPVAQIGETKYATLADAIAKAQDGDTVKLIDDISDVDITISKAITLDLDDHTITDAYIKTASTVIIQNGKIVNVNEPYPLVVNSGKLTINDVEIEASKSDRAIWVRGGELVFNSGSILATKGENNTKTGLIAAIYTDSNTDVTINGGTITVDTPNNKAVGIYGNYTNANVTVTGGKISTSGGNYSYGINVDGDITVTGGEIVTNEKGYGYSSGIRYGNNYALVTATGDVAISGGTITTNGYSGYIVNVGRTYSSKAQTVTITGGTLTNNLSEVEQTTGGHKAPVLIWEGSASNVTATVKNGDFNGFSANLLRGDNTDLAVSGGTFDVAINEEYCAEGFKVVANSDGTYGVVADPAYGKVAMIGETYYETLSAALAAVQEGQTITLIAEVSEGTVKLPAALKNVTFTAAEGVVVKNSTIMASDGNSISYEGLTFDGITFENSRISITGWRTGGATVKDLTVTNCIFKDLNDTTNSAPVHINMDAKEAVENFTFTNNVIDGATGGQKSGVYAQVTGETIFTGNTINNVSFRPYVIQVTTDDGIADEFTVTGNTFSGSAAGRAQGLGNNAEGTDAVELVVSNNIFKGITSSQQICYWNFNEATTTADLSKNYYDIDIQANPSKIYFNSAAADVADLIEMGVFPYYADEAKTELVEVQPIQVTYADGTVEYFDDMLKAVPYTTNYPKLEGATIKLLADVAAPGLRFMENDMVFDLNGHTYTITDGTGSQGTNTSGFQIRPEVTTDVLFKNGTIKVAEGAPVVWMFNVYATDFIVEDVTVDCTNMAWGYGNSCYVTVSRPGDNVQFTGNTAINNFNTETAGYAINVCGTMTIGENVNLGNYKAIELDPGASLTAPAGLTVVTSEGNRVVYENGTYTSVVIPYVAEVNGIKYESVLEALTKAIETGASEVKILTDVCEVMTSDFDLKINADLTITAEQPVKVEFYNENGTTRDFAVGSTNNNTLTIGKNVHFDLTDRVIWLGFWGNNVDVVVEGYLGGYQIWHGADTTVSSTGTLDSHGEAFVMRRDATLTVNGGKVKANYFQIYSGHIVAKDATITAGLVWINNNHASLGGEGTVSMTLDNTTFTSNGEFKAYAGEGKTVDITLTNGSSVTAAGALTTDAATTIVADATSSFNSNNKSVFVAETEGYQFTSLQAAVDAAPAGATVKLTADVNVGAGLIVNAPATTFAATSETGITLDLAGKDIVGTTNAITNNGTLTIEDSVGTGNVYTTDVAAQGRAAVVNNGTLVIKGGWFGDSNNDTTDRNAINRGNALKNYGEATINGGYFTNVSNQYIGTDAYAYAINTINGGQTTINNATIYGDINGLIYSDGKTVVNDGSFTLGRPNEENNLWYLAYGDVEIKGGTWNRAFKVPSWNTGDPTFQGNVAVSGGTFNIDVEEKYCAEGYIPTKNADGTYGVKEGSFVARNATTGVSYETFQAAYNAAQAGETIELLEDVKLTGKLTIAKAITIDGNGHSIIADETAVWYTVSGKLNIKNYKTHLLGINASGIVLKDVVLDCNNNAAGINVYCAQNVVFDNVSIINATKGTAALTVNGSTVTFKTAFTALGNTVAMDISNGSGVTSALGVTVENGTVFDLGNKIVKFESVADNNVTAAVDEEGNPYFAAMDNAYYYTQAQIDSRTNSYTNGLILLTDVSFSKDYTISSTLDLNGHKLTVAEGKVIKVTSKLTLIGGDTDAGFVLVNASATLNAAEGLNVTTTIDRKCVVYEAGTYKVADSVVSVTDANGNVTYYATLEAAFADAENGDTITMLSDVTLTKTVKVEADDKITLDLNGKVISAAITENLAASFSLIQNRGELTVTDSGNDGKISLTYTGASFGYGKGLYTISNEGGTLNIEGGRIENLTTVTDSMYDAIDNNSTLGDTVLNISGGEIYCGYLGIRQFANSTTAKNTVNVTGGKIVGGNCSIWTQNPNSKQNNANVTITDGYIDGRILLGESDAFDVAVSGGTFTVAVPESYCAEGYIPVDNGDDTYGVKPGKYVASVTAADGTVTKFETLEAAIAAAQSGETVTLLVDVALEKTLIINKSITLDADGNTITQVDGFTGNGVAAFELMGGATVTFENATFEGFQKVAVIRSVSANVNIDNCVFQNNAHTQTQGMLRFAVGDVAITNSKFLNNTCAMGITFNFDAGQDGDTFLVDNCEFTGNTASGTALVYYVTGSGAQIKNSEFVANTVNCANNGAVIYLGFQEDCVVTGNLFKDNKVIDSTASTRVAGAIFFGYEAEISGNAFVNNTASNANGDALGQICTSTYYECEINLSENYWGGNAPVYGKDYTVQHQTGDADFVLNSYYKTLSTDDATGNVALSDLVAIEYVAQVGKFSYTTLAEAFAAAEDDDVIVMLANDTVDTSITNTKKVTLDLNGKVITGIDNSNGSFGLINNTGNLTIQDSVGNGKITLVANTNRGWNAYSSVISNTVGGKLIVNGGTIEHLGGTDMAYAIDNLTNGKGTYAETIINGGNIISTYRAVRQFLNGVEAQNILTVNGGTIQGTNKAIWVQDPSKNANSGKITVEADAVINGDVYLTCTAGSDEWPVKVAIADAALKTGEILTNNLPDGYVLENNNGIWSVEQYVAYIHTIRKTYYYKTLAEAVADRHQYETIVMIADCVLDKTVLIPANQVIVLDLNGKTIDGTGNRVALQSYGNLIIKDTSDDQTGTIKAGIGTAGNAINICAGNFTLNSGNIYSLNNAIYVSDQAATVNIEGGTITAEPTTKNSAAFYLASTTDAVVNITGGKIVGYNGILLWNNKEINISGGTIEAKGSVGIQGNGTADNTEINISGDASVSGYYSAIYHPQGGELNITDNATLTGWTGVVVKGGKINISGGTITGTGAADTYAPVSSGYVDTGDALYVEHYDNSTNSENYGTPVITVTGGTFTSTNGKAVGAYANPNNNVEAPAKFISGGTFSNAVPEELCAPGYRPVTYSSTSHSVEPMPVVASVDGTGFYTLAEAFAAADGKTVTVLMDIELTEGVTVPKGNTVTLDLVGHTVSAELAELPASFALITNKGTLTVTGGTLSVNYTGESWGYGKGLYTISNEGGTLNIAGGRIENLTTVSGSMYDAIDNNSTLGDTVLNISGGEIYCGYLGIRQFANSTTAANTVNVTGGSIEGGNSAIWTQNPGSSQPKANIAISDGNITGRILLGESEAFSVAISGGTFDLPVVKEHCAKGYKPAALENGKYTVEEATYVAQIGEEYYETLAEAFEAAVDNDVIVMLANDTVDTSITNTKKVTLELNGKVITGIDNSEKSFGLINNTGNLTIQDSVGGGAITLEAKNNRGWNAYSSVISNNPGGNLTVKSGTIQHLGGTDMAYAIDNLTNGKGTSAVVTIEGGLIKSPYRAIRQFLNGVEAINSLTVKGGTVEGENKAIWFQDPSAKANSGDITVTADAEINGDVYLSVTAGSTEWPVEVAIANAAMNGDVLTNDNIPTGYGVAKDSNEIWGIIVELPEVVVTDIADTLTENDPELTFALNFAIKDVEKLTESYLNDLFAAYGSHYVDYVLTISGLSDESVTFNADGSADGYLAGQYDAWSTSWVTVPFENVTIENGESLYIMEYAAKLLNQNGLRFTLAEVAEIVQNFDCGVYFTREFLAANPNMVVTLELQVFTEDAEGNKDIISVAKNVFKAPEIVVATVNGVGYPTLAAAVEAAQDGDTVIMVDNHEITKTVVVDKKITLDLNGYVISQEKACTEHYAMIQNKGDLTITDSVGTGKISFTDTGVGDASFGWGSYTLENRGNLTVESGTIEHLGQQNTPGNVVHMYSAIQQAAGTTTINGGTISTPTYRSVRINSGDLTVNGGTFEGQVWLQPNQGDATLTVTGGTFTPMGGDASAIFMTNAGESKTVTGAEISGGTFYGKIGATVPANLAGSITGGDFTKVAAEYTNEALLKEGFELTDEDGDGIYNLTQICVAEYNGVKYLTLQEAVNAATADNVTNPVISLLADCMNEQVFVRKQLTVMKNTFEADLYAGRENGKSLMVTENDTAYVIMLAGALDENKGEALAYVDANENGSRDANEDLMTLQAALDAAEKDGEPEVRMTANLTVGTIIIPSGVTLDIQSYTLTADRVIGLNDSMLVGTHTTNTAAGGKLVVNENNMVLSEKAYMYSAATATNQAIYVIPVWDDIQNCFVFSWIRVNHDTFEVTDSTITYKFGHTASNYTNKTLWIDGASNNHVSVVLRMQWTNQTEAGDVIAYQNYTYQDSFVASVAGGGYIFTFGLTGIDALQIDMDTVAITPMYITDCGVIAYGDTFYAKDLA